MKHKKERKNDMPLAYVVFFVYLCTRKGFATQKDYEYSRITKRMEYHSRF